MYFANAVAGFSGGITGFLHNGFTVGSHATVNGSGKVYFYTCFKDNGAGDFKVGSYTGNAFDNQAVSGTGFKPDFVHVKGDSAQLGVYRHSNSNYGAS